MEPSDNIIDLAGERRRRGPRFDGGIMDILEVSRDLVCLCRGGAITAINGAGARMLGAATTDELVGRRMAEFLVPEYGRVLELFLAGMASEDKSVPTRILAADNSVKDVEMQTFRAREIAADATVVVCRLLTEESPVAVQLHESDLRFRLLADNSMSLICHVKDGTVRYLNRAGVALLGAAGPEQVVGKPLMDLLDGVKPDTDDIRALAEAGAELTLELLSVDNRSVSVLAHFTLVPSPQGLEVMIEARAAP
ncbi:MAG: PAS domain-containing protein [Rhodospirillaceae bacterium]|nr:PAS domain-containing protein [Rhodospirillales bacterium]